MKYLFGIIICFCVHQFSPLKLTKWTIVNENGTIILRNVTTPIDIYSALYQQFVIEWPLKGYNDVIYRWIALDNWTFISDPFSIDKVDRISLYVSKLDINPEIYFNNHYIGTTFSEFVSKDIPIHSSIIKMTNNVLRLKFYSPIFIANRQAKNNKYDILPNCWPDEFHGECHINLIRKTQASFGWDWGPSIASVGIRGKIELYNTDRIFAQIRNVKLLTETDYKCLQWSAEVVLYTYVLIGNNQSKICGSINVPNLNLYLIKCMEVLKNGVVKFYFKFPLNLNIVKLWWPYELGTPTLYELRSSVIYENQVIDSQSHYVGFRNVKLDQTQLQNNFGRYFGIYVNCKPFFIKGTNWIPRTYLTVNWNNESDIEFLLHSVVQANMNSIRLWGGGKPETELFYSIADNLGLMIWHDLMFACALYPDDNMFRDTVHQEVSEIVTNLQRHPSILLWSGNNEIEVLIAQGWYTKKMDPDTIRRYFNLFGKVIKSAVIAEDPFTPFILSSPSNGDETNETTGVSNDPQNVHYGDVHFYFYYGDLWNEMSYPITRMTTEFGFQSLPNINTWRMVTSSEKDFEIDGDLMKHLQHHPNGSNQLIEALNYNFGKLWPNDAVKAENKYLWFSFLSQINQANILKVYINKLLSSQCLLTSDGIGLTRGIMYWQLNDNWVAPTWSTIDYYGTWKLGHYYVKKSFSTKRISISIVGEMVELTIIQPYNPPEINYEIRIISRDISKIVTSPILGEKIIHFYSSPQKCNVQNLLSLHVEEFARQLNCFNKTKCLFQIYLTENKSIISTDDMMLVYPLKLFISPEMANDKLSVRVVQNQGDLSICSLIVHNHFIHLYVMLTTDSPGVFSDNGMHITNNETIVKFYPWSQKNDFFNCSTMIVNFYSLNQLYK